MSLKLKLIGIMGIATLVLFITFAIIQGVFTESIIENKEHEQAILLGQSIEARINKQVDSLKIAVIGISNNKETQRLFALKDRKALTDMYLPIFNQIKGEVSQFQFHLKDSTSFLRLHMPDKFGDDLSSFRFTVNDCNVSKKMIAGIEEGRGGYGFRIVAPVFYNEEHIGSVEYGADLGKAYLDGLKKEFGGEYFLYAFVDNNSVTWSDNKDNQNGLIAKTAEKDTWKVTQNYIDKTKKVVLDLKSLMTTNIVYL